MAVSQSSTTPLTPFETFLNLRIERFSPQGVTLVLPAQQATLNIGGTLHGGASVSLAVIAARRALEAQLTGTADLKIQVLDQQVQFIGTTKLEPVTIDAAILKRGRELAFAEVNLRKKDCSLVSKSLVTLRYAQGNPAADREIMPPSIDVKNHLPEEWQPGPFSAPLAAKGFGSTLGQRIMHMGDGRSIVELPVQSFLLNEAEHIDNAALGALADSTGAMACWSLLKPEMSRAATTAMHLNYYTEPLAEKLYGLGEGRWQSAESLASRFQVVGEQSGAVIAEGQLLFRVVNVTPNLRS